MPTKMKKKTATAKTEDNGAGGTSTNGKVSGADPEDIIASLKAALRFDTSFSASALPSDARGELPELLGTLRQLKQKLSSLKGAADTALTRFGINAGDTGGDSTATSAYVEMKVQLLLSYLISLVYYLLLKARGVPVRGHPAVIRLLWVRSLLEKLRPMDQRLQYQINRALQWVEAAAARDSSGSSAAVDKMALKPGELATTVDDEPEDEDDAAAVAPEDDGIYRPPKISQVEYTGDHVTEQERADKDLDRKKARLDRSEFARSLREEFTNAPMEVQGKMRSAAAEKAARHLTEQQEYEEENYTRLRIGKKESKMQKKMLRDTTVSSAGTASLNELADFRDLAAGLGGAGASGRRGKKGGGTVLGEYQDAMARSKRARGIVDSTIGGVMPDGVGGKGGGKRRGGGKGGGGKRQKN